MKKTLLSLTLLGLCTLAYSQVGVNTTDPQAMLDVRGSIRGGTNHTGTAGVNSANFGTANEVSGANSAASGSGNKVTGTSSYALGTNNEVTGNLAGASGSGNKVSGDLASASGSNNTVSSVSSIAAGNGNTSSGMYAISQGQDNKALSPFSYLVGVGNETNSLGSIVFGRYNAITDGSPLALVPTDAFFQLGNGTSAATRSNIMTVLKNGNIGIGLGTAKPNERLEINGGNVKISTLNTNTGAATDKIVVVDPSGVLKSINPSATPLNDTSSIISLSSGTIPSTAYTVLANGDVTLPDPSSLSGKMYYILKDNDTSIVVNGKMRALGGADFTSYGLNNDAGGTKGILVQSNGTSWIVITKVVQ